MTRKILLSSLLFSAALILLMQTENSLEAQQAPNTSSGDALWHLPKFGENGWFIHAHNGKVRVCNVNNASVIGNKTAPRCSNWE